MKLREFWKDNGGPMHVPDQQHYYTLGSDGEPVAVDSLKDWARWFEEAGANARIVDQTHVGDADVSTVFLGLNRAHFGEPPLLFETMIFGGPWDSYQWRYTLRAEAERGHAAIVAKLRAGEEPEP